MSAADDLRAAHERAAFDAVVAWGKARKAYRAGQDGPDADRLDYEATRAKWAAIGLADSLAAAADTTADTSSGSGRPDDATIAALAAVPPMTPEIAAELIAQGKAAAAEMHARYAEMKRAAWRETSGTGRGEGMR